SFGMLPIAFNTTCSFSPGLAVISVTSYFMASLAEISMVRPPAAPLFVVVVDAFLGAVLVSCAATRGAAASAITHNNENSFIDECLCMNPFYHSSDAGIASAWRRIAR